MKYASKISGDQPKKADSKLSSPQPGQVVRGIDGSAYRVTSKLASPDGYVVKLANLQGRPVQTPADFRPVGLTMSHFASWMSYHLAYNKDFDLYVNSYIEKFNSEHPKSPLPYPVGPDGKPFRWADWFQDTISPKLHVHGDFEQQQAAKDELIHEMLFTTLGHRNILEHFAKKLPTFFEKNNKVRNMDKAHQLTVFLTNSFKFRVSEMNNKYKQHNPEEEVSMFQPSQGETEDGGDEMNLLEQEEYGVGETEFQSAEAKRDIAKFRVGFSSWLTTSSGEKIANNFTLMFDLFWKLLSQSSSDDLPRREVEKEWMEKTGLSFGSFRDYFSRLPEMIEKYITTKGGDLGDKNVFVDLMNIIRKERTKRLRKERRVKERARPAMVSSLHIAGIEDDIAEAIGATVNPDTVDKDIAQPTEPIDKFAWIEDEEDETEESDVQDRLEYLRGELQAERISYEELMELQSLAEHIDPSDVELLEAAGVEEFPESVVHEKTYNPTDDEKKMLKDMGIQASKTGSTVYVVFKQTSDQYGKEEIVDICATPEIADRVASSVQNLQTRVQPMDIKTASKLAAKPAPVPDAAELLASILPGDRVTILRPAGLGRNGQEWAPSTGRAVMKGPYGWVLNMGGKHGTPGIAEEGNIVSVIHAKRSSFDKQAKLLRGDELTPEMRKQVENAFIYRWTTDNRRRGDVYRCGKCDVMNDPYVNEKSSEGHSHPTIPLISDDQWIKEHSFYFLNDGRLDPRKRHAEPVYLAQKNASTMDVALRFAIAKSAYNAGQEVYVYKAALYCKPCGDGIKQRLAMNGKAVPENLDETQYDSDVYPKGPYPNGGGEADSPQHCDNCGRFLDNPLTQEGYNYVNEAIAAHEKSGRGNEEVLNEWVSFYGINPNASGIASDEDAAYLSHLGSCEQCKNKTNPTDLCEMGKQFLAVARSAEKQGSDNKTSMLGHTFNDADGQAIRPDIAEDTGRLPHAYKEGDDKTAGGSQYTEWIEEYLEEHNYPSDDYRELGDLVEELLVQNFGLSLSEAAREVEKWQDPMGDLESSPTTPSMSHEDDLMLREMQRFGSKKKADTLTSQTQNATFPGTPGKAEPMAVPEAIDQSAGPHSPNAPATAPRTPGIQPKVVNVPPGTDDGDEITASAKMASVTTVFNNENGFVTDFGEPIKFTGGGEELILPRYGIWQSQQGVKGGKPQVVKVTDNLEEAKTFLGETKKEAAGTPAAVAPASKPVLPNVVQNQNIVRPAAPGAAPGATMAIMPGQEEEGAIKRHTVEPELPNAKYHMQGAWDLVAAEESRLAKAAGLNTFKITFEDGNTITTDFNGTLEDAEGYYLNNYFNFGDTDEHPKDNLQKGVSVEQVGEDPDARVNEYLRGCAARGFVPVPETVEFLKSKK